ncbi:hypothetical protein ACHWQZ_G000008 [Mnemiopsis leidyi]
MSDSKAHGLAEKFIEKETKILAVGREEYELSELCSHVKQLKGILNLKTWTTTGLPNIYLTEDIEKGEIIILSLLRKSVWSMAQDMILKDLREKQTHVAASAGHSLATGLRYYNITERKTEDDLIASQNLRVMYSLRLKLMGRTELTPVPSSSILAVGREEYELSELCSNVKQLKGILNLKTWTTTGLPNIYLTEDMYSLMCVYVERHEFPIMSQKDHQIFCGFKGTVGESQHAARMKQTHVAASAGHSLATGLRYYNITERKTEDDLIASQNLRVMYSLRLKLMGRTELTPVPSSSILAVGREEYELSELCSHVKQLKGILSLKTWTTTGLPNIYLTEDMYSLMCVYVERHEFLIMSHKDHQLFRGFKGTVGESRHAARMIKYGLKHLDVPHFLERKGEIYRYHRSLEGVWSMAQDMILKDLREAEKLEVDLSDGSTAVLWRIEINPVNYRYFKIVRRAESLKCSEGGSSTPLLSAISAARKVLNKENKRKTMGIRKQANKKKLVAEEAEYDEDTATFGR